MPLTECHILIIDDDIDLSMIIRDMLEDYGYTVSWAKDSDMAYELLDVHKFHLLILDINLPGESGFEVCRELRKLTTVPVIFASARTSEDDRVTGLDMGGDDYLSKPYSLKELLSRVNALIRRTYGYNGNHGSIIIDRIQISLSERLVRKDDKEIALSLKEFDLLSYLARRKNQAVKKEELLHEVWGIFSETEFSTVAVHIRWLREKLEDDPGNPVYIKTVWGIGYCLCSDEKG